VYKSNNNQAMVRFSLHRPLCLNPVKATIPMPVTVTLIKVV